MNLDIVLLDDISTGSTKRLSVKALVDSMDRQQIKELIPTWIEQLKLNPYSKPKTKERFGEIHIR